jgi:hypothetical protein
MKRTLCFFVFFIGLNQANGQMSKFTFAVNGAYLPKNNYMVGSIGWAAFKIAETPVKNVYYYGQSVAIWERFSNEGNALQGYVGGGFGNKKATLAAGVSFGRATHNVKLPEAEWTYSVWLFAQSNDYLWSIWGVVSPKHGYFFEAGRCLDFISNKRCENQILITNVKNQFFIAEKSAFPELNMYVFIGIGTAVYPGKEDPHHISDKPQKPWTSASGIIEVAYDVTHPKVECKTCGSLDKPTEYEKLEAEKE